MSATEQALATIPPAVEQALALGVPIEHARLALFAVHTKQPPEAIALLLLMAQKYALDPFSDLDIIKTQSGMKPWIKAEGWRKIGSRHPQFGGIDLTVTETQKEIEVTIYVKRKDWTTPSGPFVGRFPKNKEHAEDIALARAVRKGYRISFGPELVLPDDPEAARSDYQRPMRDDQRRTLFAYARTLGWSDEQRRQRAGVDSFTELTEERASRLIAEWEPLVEQIIDAEADEPIEEQIIDVETPGTAPDVSTERHTTGSPKDQALAPQPSSDGASGAVPPVEQKAVKRKAAAERPSPARKAAAKAEQIAKDSELMGPLTQDEVDRIKHLAFEQLGLTEVELLQRTGGEPIHDLKLGAARNLVGRLASQLQHTRQELVERIGQVASETGQEALVTDGLLHGTIPELKAFLATMEAAQEEPKAEREPGVIERHLNEVKSASSYPPTPKPVGEDGWAADVEQPTLADSPPDRPIEDAELPDEPSLNIEVGIEANEPLASTGDARGARVFLATFLEEQHPGKPLVQRARLASALWACGIKPKPLDELTTDEVLAVTEKLEPSE